MLFSCIFLHLLFLSYKYIKYFFLLFLSFMDGSMFSFSLHSSCSFSPPSLFLSLSLYHSFCCTYTFVKPSVGKVHIQWETHTSKSFWPSQTLVLAGTSTTLDVVFSKMSWRGCSHLPRISLWHSTAAHWSPSCRTEDTTLLCLASVVS